MNKKRVLVVDDSVFMRKIISDLIAEHPDFEVAGTAKNGREAVEMNQSLSPDCITMDVEMPEMNGLEALKQIMRTKPAPVIMLSSLTKEGAWETIQALESGAVDFVQKPSGSISLDLFKVKELLFEKLAIAAQSRIRRSAQLPATTRTDEPTPALEPYPATVRTKPSVPTASTTFEQLVAIGTSTGGPRALQQVLSRLPADFPAPIVVVQHMPPNFTHSLAMRLDSHSQIRVVEAADGMLLEAGTAYIAPGGYHMKILREQGKLYRIRTTQEAPKGGHRPSVDIMFESLLPYRELKRHIVIMTGMGSDGAKGLQFLKQHGAASTIAESEETCVVYGMPRAAVELQAVDYVLPVHEIAGQLVKLVTK